MPTDRRNPNTNANPEYADAVSVTRFWALVQRASSEECWHWLGYKDEDGYGIFQFRGVRRPAHELALSFTTGESRLANLDTCHSCDTPGCCNPGHLRFDTRLANVREMLDRGRAGRQGKLSDDQVVIIRERRAAGARQKDLAEQFGISESQVSMIVRGKRWSTVGGRIEIERKYIRG